jgi:hypothetical protein
MHDLHSDNMILLGSLSLIAGIVAGVVARLAFSGLRKRRAL